jgi:arabinan endo-1,5-alpha-L-arabinosidase
MPVPPVRARRRSVIHLVATLLALSVLLPAAAVAQGGGNGQPGTYRNPLLPRTEIGTGRVETCADPTAIYGQEGERKWFMYCTADPLNEEDRTTQGGFVFRQIPMFSSTDLVNWTYEGEAFAGNRPTYATPGAGLWAPEIAYYPETGNYHLYYTVTETTFEFGGSAIGVATSPTPLGPWTHSGAPVVEPHEADCCRGETPPTRRWVFDPEVLREPGPDYIYYGSYFGGISVRLLSETGLSSTPIEDGDPSSLSRNVAIANKYEGTEVEKRGQYYYLFLSATDCCRGPLTGYAVFVGRSLSPTGPFLDRSGQDLNDNEIHEDPTDGRAGGTPFLYGNGNRWVGTGHNHVFTDFGGQWWTLYHAIDRNDPYLGVDIFPGGNCGSEGRPDGDQCGDLSKRPVLLDAIDWRDGWPTVNGGRGPSDSPQQAPAAQPGQESRHRASFARWHSYDDRIPQLSDEFNDERLSGQWTWIREPAATTWSESDGYFRLDTQSADLFVNSNNASVLVEQTPRGDFMVETRVRVSWPAEGCCFNFVQAGLVIYEDDDNFVKLTPVSIFNTRQTEWAKELAPVPQGYPRYGNSVVGPPGAPETPPTVTTSNLGEWTRIRIVRERVRGEEHYTAYTKADGGVWERGMTWTHDLGRNARIGLVAMGGSGFTALFDYVRVYELDH